MVSELVLGGEGRGGGGGVTCGVTCCIMYLGARHVQAVGAVQLHPALVVCVDELVSHGVVHHRLIHPLVTAQHHLRGVVVVVIVVVMLGVKVVDRVQPRPAGRRDGALKAGKEQRDEIQTQNTEGKRRRETEKNAT